MQYTGESFEGLGRISERMITNRLDPARIAADEIFPSRSTISTYGMIRLAVRPVVELPVAPYERAVGDVPYRQGQPLRALCAVVLALVFCCRS